MTNLTQIPTPANQRLKRAEHRLATLRELEALTMDIIPTLGGDAPEAASAWPKGRDPARAFARLSHSLRLTQALAARVETEIAALKRPFRQVGRRNLNLAGDPLTSQTSRLAFRGRGNSGGSTIP